MMTWTAAASCNPSAKNVVRCRFEEFRKEYLSINVIKFTKGEQWNLVVLEEIKYRKYWTLHIEHKTKKIKQFLVESKTNPPCLSNRSQKQKDSIQDSIKRNSVKCSSAALCYWQHSWLSLPVIFIKVSASHLFSISEWLDHFSSLIEFSSLEIRLIRVSVGSNF